MKMLMQNDITEKWFTFSDTMFPSKPCKWGKKAMAIKKLTTFLRVSNEAVYFGFGNIWICELTLNVVTWFVAT